MKRLSLLLAGALALSACSAQPVALRSPSLDTVVPGTLTACTDMPFEPFEFRDGDQTKGIDVDLVRAVAGDLGLRADFHDSDFDTIFDDLAARRCDVVASAVSITPERQQKVLFSDGYFEVNQSLVVRSADADRLTGLPAMAGKRLGVQKGTTGEDYARSQAPQATIVPFDDGTEMVDALSRGQVDGALQDFPINSYLAHKTPNLQLVSTFTDVSREEYGFAFTQGAAPLRDAVNGALGSIRADGRYDTILRQYLGTGT